MNSRNRNNCNNNRRTNSDTNGKRYHSWNQNKDYKNDRNERNGQNNRFHNEFRQNKDLNRTNNGSKNEIKEELNQSSQMPGFPVQRNQSSPPFVCNDPKVETIVNGSGHRSEEQIDEQQLEKMSQKLAEMDVKDNKSENKETESAKNESNSESQLKSEMDYIGERRSNNENTSDDNSFNPMRGRSKTVSSDYRPKRFWKNQNQNDLNPNFAFNNSHKFYKNNNRFNGYNKYESNDQNNRFRQKSYNPSVPQMSSELIPNSNRIRPFLVNPYEPFNPYITYFIPSYVPQTQTIPPNGSETNTQLGLAQNQDNKSGTIQSQTNGSNDAVPYVQPFIKFEPSMTHPIPYFYGIIQSFNTETETLYYFQSINPSNIAPLLLEKNESGVPLLPTNCVQLL